jgi:hypothetical protein
MKTLSTPSDTPSPVDPPQITIWYSTNSSFGPFTLTKLGRFEKVFNCREQARLNLMQVCDEDTEHTIGCAEIRRPTERNRV